MEKIPFLFLTRFYPIHIGVLFDSGPATHLVGCGRLLSRIHRRLLAVDIWVG